MYMDMYRCNYLYTYWIWMKKKDRNAWYGHPNKGLTVLSCPKKSRWSSHLRAGIEVAWVAADVELEQKMYVYVYDMYIYIFIDTYLDGCRPTCARVCNEIYHSICLKTCWHSLQPWHLRHLTSSVGPLLDCVHKKDPVQLNKRPQVSPAFSPVKKNWYHLISSDTNNRCFLMIFDERRQLGFASKRAPDPPSPKPPYTSTWRIHLFCVYYNILYYILYIYI